MLLAENLQEQKYVQSRFTDRMLEEAKKETEKLLELFDKDHLFFEIVRNPEEDRDMVLEH